MKKIALDTIQLHSHECEDGSWVSKIRTHDFVDRLPPRTMSVEVIEVSGCPAADRADEIWFNSPEFSGSTRNASGARALSWLSELLRQNVTFVDEI